MTHPVTTTHRRMLWIVAVLAVLTVAGMVLLWPDSSSLPATDESPEELVGGTVAEVELFREEADPVAGTSGEMARIVVEVHDGRDAGELVEIETSTDGYPEIEPGDDVKLSRSGSGADEAAYFIVDFERRPALLWLGILFVVAVLAAGGWHGLRSLLGLGVSLLVVVMFVVPGILAGQSPFLVALVGGMAVMLLTLYVTHGVNEMTTAAVVGTAAALGLTVVLGILFIDLGKLTGFSSEEATFARYVVGDLDLQGLVLAGLIIGALGVLDDVTVTQSSTVFALHEADPRQGLGTLFRRAMQVGRDHIGSTVNTLFLAYAGASLALLVLFSTGGLPAAEIVNSEILAEAIVKTLVGSLGLIAAVPFTTLLAATIAVRRPRDAAPLPVGHHRAPAASPEIPDEELDEEGRAHRAWLRYLRDGVGDDGDIDDTPGRPGETTE